MVHEHGLVTEWDDVAGTARRLDLREGLSVREAVARATFEQLVGFQLSAAQLRYNVTR